MKKVLLIIWKWLPFRRKCFSRILLPSFQVFAVAVIFNADKQILLAKNSSAHDQIGLFYWCNIQGGTFRPSDEISEIQYFDLNNLPDIHPSDAELLSLLLERVDIIE